MTITRQEVLANRKKWIEFLKKPGRKKALNFLDEGKGRRCCLGHGCRALGMRPRIVRKQFGDYYWYDSSTRSAPRLLIDSVGLWDNIGFSESRKTLGKWPFSSLAEVNDKTSATPQQIGEYLDTVIEGGEDTPFRPLSEYPEATP